MKQATSSLLVMAVLLGLAGYTIFVPPVGMEDLPYRVILPFVLIACGFTILDNFRMRAHMTELIGAVRAVGRAGNAPSPEQRGEAIVILLKALRGGDEKARQTAATQLAVLTGANFGDDIDGWDHWWSQNKSSFGK